MYIDLSAIDKGLDNGKEKAPRVRYEGRQTRDEYTLRTAKEWPHEYEYWAKHRNLKD